MRGANRPYATRCDVTTVTALKLGFHPGRWLHGAKWVLRPPVASEWLVDVMFDIRRILGCRRVKGHTIHIS